MLASQASMACAIFTDLHLTRGIIKMALQRLQTNRRRQVVLANILCATRFKYYAKNGELLPVVCANKCGMADSIRHLLACYNLHPPYEEEEAESWVAFLSIMAARTEKTSPLIPMPMDLQPCGYREPEEELSLDGFESPTSRNEQSSMGDTLSFDGQ